MKVKIVKAEGGIKTCPNCNHDIFRKSTKTKQDENKGVTYELQICDKCGHREEYNHINFTRGGGIDE